jgi:PAS domain S-box-containing protein
MKGVQEVAPTKKLKHSSEIAVQQQRLYDLFMQTPAMIAICRGPDLVFEMANPLYLQAVGKTKAILGKPLLEALPELAGQEVLDILYTVYKTGEAFTGKEVVIRLDKHQDGNLEDVYFTFVYQPVRDENGKVDGIMTHAMDVTEHVLARKQLEKSEANFRFMAESLPQKIFMANPNGKVIYFNSQWTEYTGKTMDVLMRDGVRHFLHPDDLPISMGQWRRAIKTSESMQNEQRMLRADGQYRRHISYVRAMHDERGNIIRWFGSMTDIEDVTRTAARNEELERVTEALREQRAQLVAVNEAKDEFISVASHQLRTPATSVKQYIGMLIEGFAGDLTAQQRDFLKQAYTSNERQISIVNDLLKVALVDAGKVRLRPDKVELASMISSVLKDQTAAFEEKNQTVMFVGERQDCVIMADSELLRAALENLVDNARKYTYESKTIKVKLQKLEDKVRIIVQDEGVGIRKDQIDKLFRKFTRLDNPLSIRAGGTGLGLYWVKKIVELHQGAIKVRSKEGQGTTFTIELPLPMK